jgi:hypothetical protein
MSDPATTGDRDLPVVPATLPEGLRWTWQPYHAAWFRVYHRDSYTPSALHRRAFGPLSRFDHHSPPVDVPAICPLGRTATYLAETLRAAASEVFDGIDPFRVCPNWRLARLRPTAPLEVQDVIGAGGMNLGAGPWLGSSPPRLVKRAYTQEWARKIYDDSGLQGIRYTGSHEEGPCLVVWDRAPALELVTNAGVSYDTPIHETETWSKVVAAYAETSRSLIQIDEGECRLCEEAREAESGI